MKVRLVGLQEHYKPTPEEIEETERGFRRRHLMNPNRNPTGRETILIADLRFVGEWDSGVDVRLDCLPEGAKIGDEFELEFKPVKTGR
jgi:hypothetical protein